MVEGLWLIPFLALPHVFYLWLWTNPSAWIAVTGSVTRLLGGQWPADKAGQGGQACKDCCVASRPFWVHYNWNGTDGPAAMQDQF